MPTPLIGKDAVAYVVEGGGFDSTSREFNNQGEYNFLGSWKTIKVTLDKNWSDAVTGSSDEDVQRRRTTKDFKATLSGLIQSGGSNAFLLALNNDFIEVSFTEELSGRTMVLVGGINSSGWEHGRDDATDELEIIGVGFPNPISYA